MTGFTRFDSKDLRKERDIVYWNKAKLAITCAIDRRTNATNRPTGAASYKRDLAQVKRKIPFCLHVAKRCLAKFRPWRVRILGLYEFWANHHHSSILLLVFVLNFLNKAVFNGPSICTSIHPPVRPSVRRSVRPSKKCENEQSGFCLPFRVWQWTSEHFEIHCLSIFASLASSWAS